MGGHGFAWCTTCVNNVHCAEIVYLPTINRLSIVKCVILYFLCQHHLDLHGDDQHHYEIKGLMNSGATLTSQDFTLEQALIAGCTFIVSSNDNGEEWWVRSEGENLM